MKAAPFAYRAPETLEETLALLANGDGARVLAGGQSLVPMLKARVVKPTLVVDVNRVPGLDGIEIDADGSLRIGALTRQQTLLDSQVARNAQPLLHAAGRFAGFSSRSASDGVEPLCRYGARAQMPSMGVDRYPFELRKFLNAQA